MHERKICQMAMSGEKVEEHNLIREVGMKSRLEDLRWVDCKSFETSADVTVIMNDNRSPEWVGSGNGGGRLNWAILDTIVFFSVYQFWLNFSPRPCMLSWIIYTVFDNTWES